MDSKPIGNDEKNNSSKDNILLKCKICKEVFRNEKDLKSHEKKHATSSLYRHMKIHKDDKPFKCHVCSKEFTKRTSLDNHKPIHSGKKPFICNICSKVFQQKGNLNVHKRIHTGEKPYQCDVCAKVFMYKHNLNTHKHVHTDEKPFICNICSKGFKLKGILKIHKRVHTGEKPFICDVCSKVFTQNKNLNRHKLIHNRNKKIECDICLSKFEKLQHLKLHMLKHNGNISYKCNQCPIECLTYNNLNQHLKIHNKKFKCSVCSKLFAHSRQLTQHKISCKTSDITSKENQSTSGEPSKPTTNKIKSERNFGEPNTSAYFYGNENVNIYDELQQQITAEQSEIKTEALSQLDPEKDVIYFDSQENKITIKQECDDSYETDSIPLDTEEQEGELHSIIDIVKDEPQY